MRSVRSRCVYVAGRKTSVSLEDEFWNSLKEIADSRRETVSHLIASIDAERKTINLSSVLRLFVLRYYQDQVSRENLVDVAEAPH